MDDVAYVEESIELLPQISRLTYSAIAADPAMGSLTVAQSKAISLLYHQGDQTVSEVATGLGISLPAASELIDRLLDRRLVLRTADPKDRRRMIVSLTPESLAYARHMHDVQRTQVRAALAQMPKSEWPVFVKSLRALAAALSTSTTEVDSGNQPSRGAQCGLI